MICHIVICDRSSIDEPGVFLLKGNDNDDDGSGGDDLIKQNAFVAKRKNL